MCVLKSVAPPPEEVMAVVVSNFFTTEVKEQPHPIVLSFPGLPC